MASTTENKYYCSLCDYKTNNPSNWRKHKTTNKHIELLEKNKLYKCTMCDKIYKSKTGLASHNRRGCETIINRHYKDIKKSCIKNIDDDTDSELEELLMIEDKKESGPVKEPIKEQEKIDYENVDAVKKIVNDLMTLNKKLASRYKKIKKEKNKLEYVLNSDAVKTYRKAAQTYSNVMDCLQTYAKNVRPLKPIVDIEENIFGKSGKDYKCTVELENQIIEDIYHHYTKGRLVNFFSEGIEKYYWKKNEIIHPIYASDCQRLTYIISLVVGDNVTDEMVEEINKSIKNTRETREIKEIQEEQKLEEQKRREKEIRENPAFWMKDKKGLETCKIVVHPILRFVENIIKNYTAREALKMRKKSDVSVSEAAYKSKILMELSNLVKDIENKTLEQKILKDLSCKLQITAKHIKTIENDGEENKDDTDINEDIGFNIDLDSDCSSEEYKRLIKKLKKTKIKN